MSRTKQILSTEEFTSKRTFKKFIEGYYADLVLMDPTADDFYKAALEAVPFQPSQSYSSWNRQQSNGQKRDYSSPVLNGINADFLKKHRPQLSAAIISALTSRHYGYNSQESTQLSSFMLNEFLGQDEFEVYHDFLNAKWDDLYDAAVGFHITPYPHTVAVYQHYSSSSPFTFRAKAPKKTRMALERLTKDQLLKLVTKTKPDSVTTNSIEIYFANQVKALDGEVERQMSPQEATNQLLRAFSVSLLAGGYHSNLRLTDVYKNITEIVQELSGSRIARDSMNYTANQITPNNLGKIGTFLEKNGAEFTIAEMFFVIYSLQNHKLFARIGNTSDISELYLAFLEKDNALELFKMIGELAQGYSKQLPTAVQWRKALANGDLDFVMGSEITVVLVAASDINATPTQEIKMRRNIFGGSLN